MPTPNHDPLSPNNPCYNEFYQAITALEKFETGQAVGWNCPPTVTLARITNLFVSALNQGDCIAPHFLHYLGEKYKNVDLQSLPALEKVPNHKPMGKQWLEAYKTYLALHDELIKVPSAGFHFVKSPQDQKKFEKACKDTFDKIVQWAEVSTKDTTQPVIHYILAAKILKRAIEKFQHRDEYYESLIALNFFHAATYPNIWGMVEHDAFQNQMGRWGERNLIGKVKNIKDKITGDMQMLKESDGIFTPVFNYYFAKQDQAYYSQWLCIGAVHGELNLALSLIESYMKNKTSWLVPISEDEVIKEATLWVNWLCTYMNEAELYTLLDWIKKTLENYENLSLFAQIVLCFMLSGIFAHVIEKKSTVFIEICAAIAPHFHNLVYFIWKQNEGQRLPSSLATSWYYNALAVALEYKGNYLIAQKYYQLSYDERPDDALNQYNLANILALQGKNVEKQVELYLKAAHQGDSSSMAGLFNLAMQNKLSSAQLIALKVLIQPSMASLSLQVDETQLELSHEMIANLLDYQIREQGGQEKFLFWKKEGLNCLAEYRQKKAELFTIDSVLQQSQSSSPEVILASSSLESIENDDSSPEEISLTEDENAEQAPSSPPSVSPSSTLPTKVQKALDTLAELSEKRNSCITLGDYVRALECFRRIRAYNDPTNDSEISVSTKGKTSGSRVILGGLQCHLPHDTDRLKPGARGRIQQEIEEIREKAEELVRPLSLRV